MNTGLSMWPGEALFISKFKYYGVKQQGPEGYVLILSSALFPQLGYSATLLESFTYMVFVRFVAFDTFYKA